jgi:hypothetical protein
MAKYEAITYLLQSPALALDYEEIDEKPAENVTAGKHVAVLEIDGGNDERGEEGEEEVPEPIAGGRESHTLGTVAGGIEFAADCPTLY